MNNSVRAFQMPVIFLLKADGQFKHSGKYYLQNGRWHKLHADKPAPKGAPVAAAPHAAGQHHDFKHFTDSEWQQLKLPESNVNAGTFNVQLDKLKQYAETGNVTAILGSKIGTNTYSKKLATIKNHLLDLNGIPHKVQPGQAAGSHPAVQAAPAATLTNEGTKPDGADTNVGAKPEPQKEPEKPAQSEAKEPKPDPEKPADPPSAEPVKAPAKAEASSNLPEFDDTYGKAKYYVDTTAKVAAMISSGDTAGLEAWKAKNADKAILTGKTKNSKTFLAWFNEQQPKQAEPEQKAPEPVSKPVESQKQPEVKDKPVSHSPATGKLSQIPWDTLKIHEGNSNAKQHNGTVDKIKQLAEAGDVAGLQALYDKKKDSKQTYIKKQALLAQTALAALKESDPASAPEVKIPELPKFKDFASIQAFKKSPEYQEWKSALQQKYGDGDKWLEGPEADAFTDTYAKLMDEDGKSKAAASEQGPKEGDTKQGADGMLVFKNGRWHKQEQPKAEEPETKPAPEQPEGKFPNPPEFSGVSAKPTTVSTAIANELKHIAEHQGHKALLDHITQHKNGNFTITAAGYKFKQLSRASMTPQYAQLHKYVKDLIGASAAASGKKAPKPKATKPQPAPAPAPEQSGGIESMDSWTQTGPQGGSNPGGKFKDQNGDEWYCKFPVDEDTAKAEVLAAKLYAAVGVQGQDAKLITKNGKLGIASRWVDVDKANSPKTLAKMHGTYSGFAADAWLANWDVVGMGYDNLQVDGKGHAVRVDAGGSLMYRAQGGKKAFGPNVTELDSLRDAKINPQSAAVFADMTEADITASVAKVAKVPDSTIRKLVMASGYGDEKARKELADTLIARKNDLIAKYPKAVKAVKKRLDPNALPVDPDKLPKRHDFENWNGEGKGLSSQPHVNAANKAVEQEMMALAKQGNLTALKEFQFHAIDKATGNATGKLIPIDKHPSKHVVQLHSDLVQMLDEIANPPQPLKVFRETDVGTLDELDAVFPPKPFGTTTSKVSSNEKLGFWVVLGGVAKATVEKLKPKKVMDYTPDAIKAGYTKYQQGSKLAKHFIHSVQASGSYNDLFRDGKTHDHQGNKLSDVAQAALEHATTMPEGTSIYRWQNMPDEMVNKMLSAPDGTIIQATGPMCTSYSPTATTGFGKHKITIRYAKGAKGVESFGSGNFSGEKEVTTLPNARFVLLKKEMVNDPKKGGQRLDVELLMLPPDLGL